MTPATWCAPWTMDGQQPKESQKCQSPSLHSLPRPPPTCATDARPGESSPSFGRAPSPSPFSCSTLFEEIRPMRNDRRRITLITRPPSRNPARFWNMAPEAPSRVIVVGSFTVLRYALDQSLSGVAQDVDTAERLVQRIAQHSERS